MPISPLAVIETTEIGSDVVIEPFAVIGPHVRIGDRAVVRSHSVLDGNLDVGEDVLIMPGAHVGKVPSAAVALSRAPGPSGTVVLGARSSVGAHAVIYTDVTVGSDTLIGDGVSLREGCRIGERCLLGRYVSVNYDSSIGNETKIMDVSHITGNTRVGSRVFIGMMVSTANDNLLGARGYDAQTVVGPSIEDDAKIGTGAIILPGVVVGRGAIVAAGALVSRDVTPGSTVMGVPARPVDRRRGSGA